MKIKLAGLGCVHVLVCPSTWIKKRYVPKVRHHYLDLCLILTHSAPCTPYHVRRVQQTRRLKVVIIAGSSSPSLSTSRLSARRGS